MATYAVRGDVYVNPDSAGDGGTLVSGLDPTRPVMVYPANPVRHERFGGADDAVRSFVMPGAGVWVLELPLIGDGEAERMLALAPFLDAGEVRSVSPLGFVPPASVVIRPRDTSERYIFMPAVRQMRTSEVIIARSRVAEPQFGGTVLMLVCGRSGDTPAVVEGTASEVGEAIEGLEDTEMQYVRRTITLANLVALGAAQAGHVAFADAIPANAVPMAVMFRNRGTAFTSSDGALGQLSARITASAQTAHAVSETADAENLHTAGNRAGFALSRESAGSAVAPWPNSAWTPQVYVTADQDFDSFEGGDDGIEVVIFYARYVPL